MPEITQDELDKFKADSDRVKDLEASKSRVEDEAAKIKLRAKEAEEKLSAAEQAKLEAEGNTQALLDKERAEKVALQDKIKVSNKTTLKERLRTEAMKHAKDAHDIDMVLKVADHKDLLKLDEEALTVDGVEAYVAKVRETHKYLFSSKRMDAGDNLPPGGNEDDLKTEDQKYQAELRACTTRQQMNDVRKKHGKTVD